MHKLLVLFLIFWGWSFSLFSQNSISLAVKSFERHAELSWEYTGSNAAYYRIWKSENGAPFSELYRTTEKNYLYFTRPDSLEQYHVFVEVLDGLLTPLASSDTLLLEEKKMSDEALVDMVQEATFRYFWDFAHPSSGLARERNSSGDLVTIGGSGFGVMAILVGIENGYISREQGLQRLLKIVSFLQFADKFHGVFPHWMDGRNGDVIPFGQYDNGGDLVETAFLMEGLLTARAFFDGPSPEEQAVRKIITKLWEAVEWDFYTKNNSGVLYWHWSPQHEWRINHAIRGYNEALIVYLLAISSPTHPVPPSYWQTGWAGGNYKNGLSYYGFPLPVGPAYGGPLFFAHYSYLGFDPRGIKDKYCNYFHQNTQHTLINRAYCISNPLKHKSYSADCWGLTASDDPNGYVAHEPVSRDNGTITPTAALSSWPYTPEYSMDALRYFYFVEGEKLWGKYGFYDAFNPSKNWYATSYLAIDQGPIVGMMQNHKTGLLWRNFMLNPEIKTGLDKIGFVEDLSTTEEGLEDEISWQIVPAIGNAGFVVETDLQELTLTIYDENGRKVDQMAYQKGEMVGTNYPAGKYLVTLSGQTSRGYRWFIKI